MFNKFPTNKVRDLSLVSPLATGYDSITDKINELIQQNSKHCIIAIDGTHGVNFQKAIQIIVDYLEKRNYLVDIHSTTGYLLSGEALRQHFATNISSNRAFGYVTEGSIDDYFIKDAQIIFNERVTHLMKSESLNNKITIVFGPGAAWLTSSQQQLLFFLDLSRELQQTLHRNHLINFGFNWNRDAIEKYKICLFIEWPILEKYRKKIFEDIDFYVDMNNSLSPVLTSITNLKKMIASIVKAPLRVKPFFAPGVWGGQYLKELCDLPKDWLNCAWGFEPIAPENSILISYRDTIIEIPFLIVMALEHRTIMGQRNVNLFGDYFPVRFDYLDTIDGDNLSCQVHPHQQYIREVFNEKMPQQESYYIMKCEKEAKVYLGFKENMTEHIFLSAVEDAQSHNTPLNLADYVNEFDTNKGELYLIPPGTIHCSGKNNLVLEISSTTWWFTFKIYDYLRKDIDGKPRSINIDHGFENLDFYKDTNWVKDNLMPTPQLIKQVANNKEYLLGQRKDLLFYVKSIELVSEWLDDTADEFIMFNLVEGERVRIMSCQDETLFVDLSYAESYIIPSVFGTFKLINLTLSPCKLIKAGVSPNWDVSLL